MKRLLAVLLMVGLFAGVAYAHNGMIHVLGTVAAISDTSVTVNTPEGKAQTVVLNGETKYLKGTDAADLKSVHVGDHVVVHAVKKCEQLVAAEVKVGWMHPVGAGQHR